MESIASLSSLVHLTIFHIKLLTGDFYLSPSTRRGEMGQITQRSRVWGRMKSEATG